MKARTRHLGLRRVVGIGVLALVVVFAPAAAANGPENAAISALQPIDKQSWVDQGELTWADYVPVPDRNPAYYEPATAGTESQYRTAIVLVDFPDQPFLISQPPGSHPFGNPQPGWTPIAPAEVRQWMHEYYSTPNQYNGGMTIHSYWIEDTHGRIGVEPTTFGPYTMPGDLHEYGLAQFNGNRQLAGRLQSARQATPATATSGSPQVRSGAPTSAARRRCAATTTSSMSLRATTSHRPGRSSARCCGRIRRTFRPPSGLREQTTARC